MFGHLQIKSAYSFQESTILIQSLIDNAKSKHIQALALTDDNNMYGAYEFYEACTKASIKPILGVNASIICNDDLIHLALYARDDVGYKDLVRIVSDINLSEHKAISLKALSNYRDHLYIVSHEYEDLLLQKEEAKEKNKDLFDHAQTERPIMTFMKTMKSLFGASYRIMIVEDGLKGHTLRNQTLITCAQYLDIPCIWGNDVRYLHSHDAFTLDLLQASKKGEVLNKDHEPLTSERYLKSEKEIREIFSRYPDIIKNTEELIGNCYGSIQKTENGLPHYKTPNNDSGAYLRHLCIKGLKQRFKNQPITDDYKDRLLYELKTIHTMGYDDYFLIVFDYVQYAKKHGILVGPGRGSAAGSLVAYCLGITNIDPLKYDLLFERFLNPERVSMPDIDVDFCFERRQEVIDYVVRKYGKEKVVQIVTFGTLAARGVIRDVGRVMDIPYALVDSVAKMIPQELNITIDKALKMNPDLKKLYDEDMQMKRLIDMSRRLEGLPRHTSMHAAGVVICQKAADEYVPLALGSDGSPVTQFTMTTLEELGLLKMDFLGLRTLTVIQNAVKFVEQNVGVVLDMDHIDYNDPQVLASLSTGKTDGVFQLESAGMKNFMKELKPESLEDIIAGIALYRPGPMDFIPQYIKGKNHAESITYDCPQLKPILEATYGCIVYQEQVMQIVRDLGGYTLGRSDLLRRAMSKKKAAVMEKERRNFVYGNEEEGVPGCIKNGISEEVANKIYDDMIDFAKYAFNKSHAAAYAVVSYQTAYLKYYYPVEFMAALMTSVIDNSSKVAEYHMTCRQMGIQILPPDINLGESGFTVDGNNIRYGLSAIKSVGKPVIAAIVDERKRNGVYTSLKNFMERLSGKEINKRTVENFIKSGAFDSFGANRHQFMLVYAQLMDSVNQERKNSMTGQMSLFDFVGEEQKKEFEITLPDVDEYEKEQLLAYEKEVLGFYVSGHPLEKYEGIWKKHITNVTSDFALDEETGRSKVTDGMKTTIGGMIVDKTIKYTRTNQTMAFLTLEDLLGTVEVVVFPRDYEKNKNQLVEEEKVFITGRVSVEEDKPSKLICEKIKNFKELNRELWIQFSDMNTYQENERTLYNILRESDGKDRVVIYVRSPKAIKRLSENWTVQADENLIQKLSDKFGAENIKTI